MFLAHMSAKYKETSDTNAVGKFIQTQNCDEKASQRCVFTVLLDQIYTVCFVV